MTTRLEQALRDHTVSANGITESFLTILGSPESMDDSYPAILGKLSEGGLYILSEKIYGSDSQREALMASRSAARLKFGLDESTPATFIGAEPVHEGSFAGIQVWAMSMPVETIELAGLKARRLQTNDGCWLYIPNVQGSGSGVSTQANSMFQNARRALNEAGFDFHDLTRTWIYMPRLLDWYGEMNRIRTLHYGSDGLGLNGLPFPASTAIQGRCGNGEISMDLLVMKGSCFSTQPLFSSQRQGPAMTYGSSFLRGMSLTRAGLQTVHVSGTASIDRSGRTIHFANPEQQCLETLLCISALLEEVGGSLQNIVSSTIFCKSPQIATTFRRLTKLLGTPDFPLIPVVADVCRHELLVEIEAVAIVPGGRND